MFHHDKSCDRIVYGANSNRKFKPARMAGKRLLGSQILTKTLKM